MNIQKTEEDSIIETYGRIAGRSSGRISKANMLIGIAGQTNSVRLSDNEIH